MTWLGRIGQAARAISQRMGRSQKPAQPAKPAPSTPKKVTGGTAGQNTKQTSKKANAEKQADALRGELQKNNMAVKGKDTKTIDRPPDIGKGNGNSSSSGGYQPPPKHPGGPTGKSRGKGRSL